MDDIYSLYDIERLRQQRLGEDLLDVARRRDRGGELPGGRVRPEQLDELGRGRVARGDPCGELPVSGAIDVADEVPGRPRVTLSVEPPGSLGSATERSRPLRPVVGRRVHGQVVARLAGVVRPVPLRPAVAGLPGARPAEERQDL